jgi:hypothetical protein
LTGTWMCHVVTTPVSNHGKLCFHEAPQRWSRLIRLRRLNSVSWCV